MKKTAIEQINEMRDMQGQKENIDFGDSAYMVGLYNGLELASATVEGRIPNFLNYAGKRLEPSGMTDSGLHSRIQELSEIIAGDIHHGECLYEKDMLKQFHRNLDELKQLSAEYQKRQEEEQ